MKQIVCRLDRELVGSTMINQSVLAEINIWSCSHQRICAELCESECIASPDPFWPFCPHHPGEASNVPLPAHGNTRTLHLKPPDRHVCCLHSEDWTQQAPNFKRSSCCHASHFFSVGKGDNNRKRKLKVKYHATKYENPIVKENLAMSDSRVVLNCSFHFLSKSGTLLSLLSCLWCGEVSAVSAALVFSQRKKWSVIQNCL